MRQNLPAAVIAADDPRAAEAARVVPCTAKLTKVGTLVLGYHKPKRGRRGDLRPLRVAEMKRLIVARHGRNGVDTDDGPVYLDFAFQHLSDAPAMRAFARRWLPLVSKAEMEAAIDAALSRPRRFTADAAARALMVRREERQLLKLCTIGALDHDAIAREEERRCKDRDRKRAKRAALPKRISHEAAQPWLAEGVSRATWFRHRKAGRETENVGSISIRNSTADAKSLTGRKHTGARHRPVHIVAPAIPVLICIGTSARALQARVAHLNAAITTITTRLSRVAQAASAFPLGGTHE